MFDKIRYLNLGCGSHFHPDWVNLDFHSNSDHVTAHDLRKGIPFEDETFEVVYHSHLLEHFPRYKAKAFIEECFRVLRPRGILRIVVPDLEQIAREYLKVLESAVNGSEDAAHNYDWILLEMYDQAVRHYSGGEMAVYLTNNYLPNENYIIQRFGYEGETLIQNLRGRTLNNDPETMYYDDSDELALAVGRFRLGGEAHQWMYDRYSLGLLLKKCRFENIHVCQATESKIPNFSEYHLDVMANSQVRKPDSLFIEATKPSTGSQSWLFQTETNPDILKIVQIATSDIQGGAARAAYRLHQGLRLLGQESLVLSRHRKSDDPFVFALADLDPDYQSWPMAKDLWAEIQPHYIDNNRTELSNTLFSFPYPTIDLTAIEQIQQADILNLHWIAWFQSAETIAALLALGKPVLWTLHDMAPFTGGCHYSAGCQGYQTNCQACPQLKDDRYGLPEVILDNKLAHLSAYPNLTLVTPSRWLGDCARKSQLFRNHRVEVIPYGLDVNRFRPIPKHIARKQLEIPDDTIVLLFGADSNLEQRKGASLLIEALRQCCQNPIVRSLIEAGKIRILNFGYGLSGLDDLEIPVTALGHINSDEELCYVYSSATVLLLPSLEDNLPNLMLEAMSCGTPLIAFAVGGMMDLIEDGKTGRLVPPFDIHTFSDMIIDGLTNPDLYGQMGLAARDKILKEYSLEHQANQYLHLYQDLLASYRHGGLAPAENLPGKSGSILLENQKVALVAIQAGQVALDKDRKTIVELKSKINQTEEEVRATQAEL